MQVCGGLLLIISICSPIMGQTILLHGQIIDGTNLESLSDVHVYKSAHKGTSTDIDGVFRFNVEYLDTLYFSRLGYDSLQFIVTSKDESQRVMLSMHASTIILESVEVKASDFQAPTIIRRYQPESMKVPGVKYSETVHEEDYHMGLGAIGSPATAIYRLVSKQYKQEKKNYEYLKQTKIEDEAFAKASENLDYCLVLLEAYIDPYYYRDFIQYGGLTVRYVAESSTYDLIQVLPQAIKQYAIYLDTKAEKD